MDVRKVIGKMTLEEKAGLCSGADFWYTKALLRLGIPAVMLSDGPHGLRKQEEKVDHLGIHGSIPAVCFPAGCALASSFDRDLAKEMGQALAKECQAENITVLLGPSVNIKRSPLGGRNFEYFSEDPFVAGQIGAALVSGMQSGGTAACVKHYLANNQEHRRMSSSSQVDERTLREIYLYPFEQIVKEAAPWSIMCAYNRLNGVYMSENKAYLTDVLRKEWGFDGIVVSDWGAVNDRAEALKAGMDLEMPGSCGVNDRQIVRAVQEGHMEEAVVDQAVERILRLIERWQEHREPDAAWDKEKHHELACRISTQSAVLLKNEGALPLSKNQKIVVIGEFAKTPRFEGGGSSLINAYKTESFLDVLGEDASCSYCQGYRIRDQIPDEVLEREAVREAQHADVAVIFAGLPDEYESEGYDRAHLHMPQNQNRLIELIAKVQPNTVVVLHNGSPVDMPWCQEVNAILEMYLGGQAVGRAAYDLLFAKANPSGKLAETFPMRLEDTPCYPWYPGEGDLAQYREGIFVGYRYYEMKKMEVLFPFGHGLSYTDFVLENMEISQEQMQVKVRLDVKNIGQMDGSEVVQIYVRKKESRMIRAEKELKGFSKVFVKKGESRSVEIVLDQRAFSYYDTEWSCWQVEGGDYEILAGTSSQKIWCRQEIQWEETPGRRGRFHINSTFGDILQYQEADEIMAPLHQLIKEKIGVDLLSKMADTTNRKSAMFRDTPMRWMVNFGNGHLDIEQIKEIVDQLNALF